MSSETKVDEPLKAPRKPQKPDADSPLADQIESFETQLTEWLKFPGLTFMDGAVSDGTSTLSYGVTASGHQLNLTMEDDSARVIAERLFDPWSKVDFIKAMEFVYSVVYQRMDEPKTDEAKEEAAVELKKLNSTYGLDATGVNFTAYGQNVARRQSRTETSSNLPKFTQTYLDSVEQLFFDVFSDDWFPAAIQSQDLIGAFMVKHPRFRDQKDDLGSGKSLHYFRWSSWLFPVQIARPGSNRSIGLTVIRASESKFPKIADSRISDDKKQTHRILAQLAIVAGNQRRRGFQLKGPVDVLHPQTLNWLSGTVVGRMPVECTAGQCATYTVEIAGTTEDDGTVVSVPETYVAPIGTRSKLKQGSVAIGDLVDIRLTADEARQLGFKRAGVHRVYLWDVSQDLKKLTVLNDDPDVLRFSFRPVRVLNDADASQLVPFGTLEHELAALRQKKQPISDGFVTSVSRELDKLLKQAGQPSSEIVWHKSDPGTTAEELKNTAAFVRFRRKLDQKFDLDIPLVVAIDRRVNADSILRGDAYSYIGSPTALSWVDDSVFTVPPSDTGAGFADRVWNMTTALLRRMYESSRKQIIRDAAKDTVEIRAAFDRNAAEEESRIKRKEAAKEAAKQEQLTFRQTTLHRFAASPDEDLLGY